MLHIKQVYDKEDLLILGNLKMDLMQYHLKYAIQIGINDKELLQYTLEQSLSTTPLRDNFIFLEDGEIVGMAQVEEQISAVDDTPILFVHSIYIRPDVRHVGIGGGSFGIYAADIKNGSSVSAGMVFRPPLSMRKPDLNRW